MLMELRVATEKLKSQETFEQGVRTIVDLVRKNGDNVPWKQYT